MCQPRIKCDNCGKLSRQQDMILAIFKYKNNPEEKKLLCPRCYKIRKEDRQC